jgi:hypothetical protein
MAGGIGFISGQGGILDCLSIALYVGKSKSSLSRGGPTRLSSPIQGCSYNQPRPLRTWSLSLLLYTTVLT